MRSEFEANEMLASMTSKEENALNDLLSWIEDGREYPDAEWKVCRHHGIKVDRLRGLYDSQCMAGY